MRRWLRWCPSHPRRSALLPSQCEFCSLVSGLDADEDIGNSLWTGRVGQCLEDRTPSDTAHTEVRHTAVRCAPPLTAAPAVEDCVLPA